jgi:hypothetical protein
MATSDATEKRPLWLSIEEQILKLDSQDLSSANLEASVQRIAGELDGAGYNLSRHGGNLIQLRFALEKASEVGSPFMKEFNAAVSTLTLEDAADTYTATNNLLEKLSATWPEIKMADRRPDVIKIVEQTKLDLLIAKAKGMDGDAGIRLLIEEGVDFAVITKALGITDEKLNEVHEQIKKERAERARVAGLLEKVADKSADEKIRHLFDNDVAEALIIEMAKVDQAAIEGVKKAMEEELKEKQRLAEEEAARKKKEAEGPSLADMSAEDMAYYIDQIREIMEFSEEEKEIRVMCEQSSVPKALVDIAVSDPGKLDELEKQAQG